MVARSRVPKKGRTDEKKGLRFDVRARYLRGEDEEKILHTLMCVYVCGYAVRQVVAVIIVIIFGGPVADGSN